MNRIYCSIFNAALGAWVAVPETAKARGKSNGSARTARGTRRAAVFAGTLLAAGMTMAGMASAQTWTGATDTNWETGTNWTGGTPAAADTADINSATGNQPTLGSVTPGLTATNVSAGTLTISASGELVSTDVNIFGTGAIQNAGAITGNVSVSDTGNLTNNGGSLSGSLSLNDSGSFRAATSGTIGALTIGSNSTATISAAAGTTLTQTGSFNAATPSGSLAFGSATDTGRVVMTANGGTFGSGLSLNVAGGTLAAAGSQFAGVMALISSTSVAAGATLDIGSINTTVNRLGGAGTVTNSSATDRVLTLTNTSTFAGAIDDGATNNISLVRSGAGTTTLAGANGYTGTTTVAGGTLALGSGSSLASTAVTIDAGAVLSTDGEHLADGTTLANNGQFTVTGAETIGEINGTGAVTLTDPGVLTIAGAATATISNVFNGSGGLAFTNAGGAHTLSGANTHTGATTLEAGGLTLAGGAAIANTGAVVVNDGTLTLANSETIGALSGTGGAIQLGNNTLTVNASSGSSDYAGTISGSGSLTKTGAGTLALSGANTYTGNTTLNAGTLAVNNGAALGAAGNLNLSGGTLLATADASITKSTFNMDGSGTLAAATNQTLAITAQNFSFSHASPSTLTIGAAGQEGTVEIGALTNIASNSIDFFLDVVTGTLQAGNSFTASSLFSANHMKGVSIGADGTFNLNGFDSTLNNLTGTGSIVNNSNTHAVLRTSGATDFGGVIADGSGSGQTSLRVNSGTTTLTGANTYTGTTLLSGGNLTLSGAGALSSTDVTINAGRTLTTQGGATTGLASGTALSNSGVLTLTGDEEIGSIAGSGAVNLGASTLTTGGLNSDTTLSGVVSGAGGLTKTGTGNQTLNGVNTYTGGTNLNAGTLTLGNAAALGTGVLTVGGTSTLASNAPLVLANNINLNAELSVGGTPDLTLAGVLSGTGSLIKSGVGTLLLSGNNTFSGGTTVSGGTLQGSSASLQGDILNNAMVNFDQAVDGTYASAMSGSGNLIKSGAGTLLLSGSNAYSGGTTVSGGTLQGDTTSLQGNILNNAMVNFEQAADGTYAGAMSGTGSLLKSGAGALTLSGVNSYSGTTTVAGGLLAVNGSIANSATTVNSGGRLGGSGTVGSLVVNGGIVAPGNSIGTLTVNGDLTLASGSTYEVEVDSAGSGSDLIQVNGVANLGGQVQHVGDSGTYTPYSTYTILSATGGFAGSSFDGVTSNYAFLTPTLSYDLNNVYLGLLRNDVAVADFGQTSNQIATASALDSLPMGGALQLAVLGLQADEVPGALNALSGELYASAAGAVLQNSQAFSHNLLQRSGSLLDESKRTALPLWIESEGATRRNDGDSNTAEAIQRGGSVAVGGELDMPNDWILGGAFRYGDHRLSVDERNSHADIDSYSFGLYGRWAEPLDGGSLRMTLGGIYGWHSIDADRDIYTPGMRQSLSADYDATSRQVFGELGYAMDMGDGIQLEPYAALSWTQAHSDSFTEKGGDAALHGDSQNNDMTASTLGLRSQVPLNNGQFQLDAGLGWQHNYSDVNPDAELNFVGSSTYTVEGASLGRDTALLDLGASYRIAPSVTVRAGYSGQFGDNVSSNGGNLTLTWEL